MEKTYIYYINGEWVKSDEATIPFNDAGFLYGDGLFETMRFDNNKIFYYHKHFNRLQEGLKYIHLDIPFDNNKMYGLLNQIIQKNSLKSGIIRLMITRGNLNNLLSQSSPNIYINIKPFYQVPSKPVKIIFYNEKKFPIIRSNPAIKSMNYIGNMLAKKTCDNEGGFEPAFYNENNIITECAIRNIFFIKKSILYTPSSDLGILSGVMRDTIFEIAKLLNIKYYESNINIKDIEKYDEAFITSTGIGLLPCYWDGFKSKYELTSIIKKELFNRINNN